LQVEHFTVNKRLILMRDLKNCLYSMPKEYVFLEQLVLVYFFESDLLDLAPCLSIFVYF